MRPASALVFVVCLLCPAIETHAQVHTTGQRLCAIKLHKDLSKLAALTSAQWQRCIRDRAVDTAVEVASCVEADSRGKLAKARQKLHDDYDKKCSGEDRRGLPRVPPFGGGQPDSIEAAVALHERELVEGLLGVDVDAVVDASAKACHQGVLKGARACQRARGREYRKCLMAGLKGGVQTASDLQDACLGELFDPQPDPAGRIAKVCTTPKLQTRLDKKCGGADVGASFPACGATDAAGLVACLDRRAACGVCRELNVAGSLTRDCDLFDDGALNGSCGDRAFPALDAVQFPEDRLGPIAEELSALAARSAQNPDLKDLGPVLADGGRHLDDALRQLPEGEVESANRALALVARDVSAVLEETARRIAQVLAAPVDEAESEAGDSGSQGTRLAPLVAMEHDLQDLYAAVLEQSLVFERIESEMDGPAALGGAIGRVDDANRRVQLVNGEVLGYRPSDDARLDVSAAIQSGVRRGLGDGSSLIEAVAAELDPSFHLDVSACIGLGVAPAQPFPPFFQEGRYFPYTSAPLGSYGRRGLQAPTPQSDPYVAHAFEAYAQLGTSLLERGMRLIALKKPCVTDFGDTPEDFHRYSIEITAATSGGSVSVAKQLEPQDEPVPITGLPTSEIFTFEIKYKRQHCTHLPESGFDFYENVLDTTACHSDGFCPIYPQWDTLFDTSEPDPYDCEPAEVETDSVQVLILERGEFCTANYGTRTFSLEDLDLSSVSSSRVTSIDLAPGLEGDFWADGAVHTFPTPIGLGHYEGLRTPVTLFQDFAVHAWEPCYHRHTSQCHIGNSGFGVFPTSSFFAWERGGTDVPSALRWPRVVGEQSGLQYAYSCSLPTIVRDRIRTCIGLDQFYRFPMPASEGDITMGQGQAACTCSGCSGCGCTHAEGCTQHYALDILGQQGVTPLVAARGGFVDTVVNGQMGNCWGMSTCPMGNWGNWVRVAHSDGTSASYQHMPFMAATVVEGQRVFRGWQLGVVGNTGNSSDPHTHFQIETSPSDNTTIPLRMEFERKSGNSYQLRTCDVPNGNEVVRSTN